MRKRIFISVTKDASLSDEAIDFKWRLIRHIEWLGFIPELFLAEQHIEGSIAMHQSWTFSNLKSIILRCSGAIIIGLKRNDESYKTEYNQIVGTEIISSGIPFILLVDFNVPDRGIFYQGNGYLLHRLKDLNWTHTKNNTTTEPKLSNLIEHLKLKVEEQKHVFVGYCSLSESFFDKVSIILAKRGVTIINWQKDFHPSKTVMEQVQDASRRSTLGIFLFTKDDMKNDGEFLPRDNVLFEAGFFTHSKGRDRVLMIKEEGTKMPVDLDGLLYVNVKDKNNLDDVEEKILKFVMDGV